MSRDHSIFTATADLYGMLCPETTAYLQPLQVSIVCYVQRPQHIYSYCRSLWFALSRDQSIFKANAGLYGLLCPETRAYLQSFQVSRVCYVQRPKHICSHLRCPYVAMSGDYSIFTVTAGLYGLLCQETTTYLQLLQVSIVCNIQRP